MSEFKPKKCLWIDLKGAIDYIRETQGEDAISIRKISRETGWNHKTTGFFINGKSKTVNMNMVSNLFEYLETNYGINPMDYVHWIEVSEEERENLKAPPKNLRGQYTIRARKREILKQYVGETFKTKEGSTIRLIRVKKETADIDVGKLIATKEIEEVYDMIDDERCPEIKVIVKEKKGSAN